MLQHATTLHEINSGIFLSLFLLCVCVCVCVDSERGRTEAAAAGEVIRRTRDAARLLGLGARARGVRV